MARRQEALRTAFVFEHEQVVRKVLAEPVAEPLLPLGAGTGFEEAAATLLNADTFDLAAGRVYRAAVAPDARGATVFLAVHHVAFDGLSQEVFAADLACAYARAIDGVATDLPVLERAEAAELTPAATRRTRHTLARLAGWVGRSSYPGRRPGAEPARARCGWVSRARTTYPPTTWQAVRDQARRSACSPFAVLLAAYGRALAEITGGSDFCIGTPVAARSAGQEDELGCLINVLPVRMPELSGPGVVERVWAAVRESILGSALPRYEIVRAAHTVAGGRMPVYQALFAFENWRRVEHAAGPVRMHTVPVPPVGAVAEVQLQVCELPDGTLTCIVQAPLTGSWPQRLRDLLRAFDSQLAEIAPSATTSATPHSFSSEAPA